MTPSHFEAGEATNMTTTVSTINNLEKTSHTRRIVMGIIFLVFSAAIWFLFIRNLEPGVQTTFKMIPGGSDQNIADWVFSTLPMLKVLAGVSLVAGGYQLARGFQKQTNFSISLRNHSLNS